MAVAVVAVLVLAGAVVRASLGSDAAVGRRTTVERAASTASTASAGSTNLVGGWARVLERLDRRRSAAWRAGDPHRLDTVFSAGSPPLRHDRALLRAYGDRGLALSRARLSYLRVRLVRRHPGRATLATVDRLDTVQVARGSAATLALPLDQPTRHRIVLVRTPQGWRIVAVHRY